MCKALTPDNEMQISGRLSCLADEANSYWDILSLQTLLLFYQSINNGINIINYFLELSAIAL